ncbi:hypothetical protein ABPG74_020065 [Tetrahymena malaccensis]
MDSAFKNTQNLNQILCQQHIMPCQFLQIGSENPDTIYACSDCVYSNNNYKQFLLLHDIIDLQDNTVIASWPLLDQQELINKIRALRKYQGDQKPLQKDIKQFFDDLQKEIIQVLKTQEKNMLIYADSISEKTNQLFDYYREIAQFDTLKNIIISNSEKQQKAEQILQIFKTNKQNQAEYINRIKSQLSQLNQLQILDLNELNYFKDSILSQIQLIDGNYLSQLKCFSKKNFVLIDELKNQQQNKNILLKENENLDNLLKLISNKTNNCNEKYLQSVKCELLKMQDIINLLNLDKEIFQKGKKQILTEKLNQDQIDQLETLINKTAELNQQHQQLKEEDKNMLISSKLQPFSYLIFNNVFKFDNILTKQKLESISKLLRNFPIFEIEQLVKPQTCQLDVEISNWGNYHTNGKQSIDNDGNQKFEAVANGNFIFYMKIKQDCYYRLVIKFELLNQNQNNQYLFIGLVGQSHKNCQYVSSNNIINSFSPNSNHGDKGVSKVIKGKCLRDVKYPQEYNQIEITFCVKRKIFQVCDYPKRENINEINDNKLNLIDTNQEYSLGFHLYYLQNSLTILKCEEFLFQN